MGFFSRISGLQSLIERYQTDCRPEGPELVRQTVGFGAVKYRHCVTVQVGQGGIYLWVKPPFFSHPRLCIPWTDVASVTETTMYHRAAVEIQVKDARCKKITVYRDLFDRMQPFLPAAGQSTVRSA